MICKKCKNYKKNGDGFTNKNFCGAPLPAWFETVSGLIPETELLSAMSIRPGFDGPCALFTPFSKYRKLMRRDIYLPRDAQIIQGASVVNGNVFIEDCNTIISLAVLEGIETITDHLVIRNCPILYHLNGCQSLRTIKKTLSVNDNKGLCHITDLSGLTKVAGLFFCNNFNLTTLDGLEQITEINGALTIRDNPVLQNLDGLRGLRSVSGTITIENNKNLTPGKVDIFLNRLRVSMRGK